MSGFLRGDPAQPLGRVENCSRRKVERCRIAAVGRAVSISMAARSEEAPVELWTPAHNLLLAIIKRALDDVDGTYEDSYSGPAKIRLRKKLRRRAWRWFHSQRSSEGSYLWVCSLLGFDPKFIRRQLRSHAIHTGVCMNGRARERHAKSAAREKSLGKTGQQTYPARSCFH
jgi:hypothetical protein